MRPYVTVVTGCPRSGTSLVMQMLAAGGLPVFDAEHAAWPGYETPRVLRLRAGDVSWVESAAGCALKVLMPLYSALPRELPYRFIVCGRDRFEQARSVYKFERQRPRARNLRRLARVIRREMSLLAETLESYPSADLLRVEFEDLLGAPDTLASTLDAFVGPLNVELAAAQVRRRAPGCHPTMLEDQMREVLT